MAQGGDHRLARLDGRRRMSGLGRGWRRRGALASTILAVAAASPEVQACAPTGVFVVLDNQKSMLDEVDAVCLEPRREDGRPPAPEPPGAECRGLELRRGTGPPPDPGKVVFAKDYGSDLKAISGFRGRALRVACFQTVINSDANPVSIDGKCWAEIHYQVTQESCWDLEVTGKPSSPPFRVLTQDERRDLHRGGPEEGWNIERGIPRSDYVRVEVRPPDAPESADPLFVTGDRELGEALVRVPKSLDCRELVKRIASAQMACKARPPCSETIAERFLKPYLSLTESETQSDPGLTLAAARNYELKRATEDAWLAEHVPAEDCELPLQSVTFSRVE